MWGRTVEARLDFLVNPLDKGVNCRQLVAGDCAGYGPSVAAGVIRNSSAVCFSFLVHQLWLLHFRIAEVVYGERLKDYHQPKTLRNIHHNNMTTGILRERTGFRLAKYSFGYL